MPFPLGVYNTENTVSIQNNGDEIGFQIIIDTDQVKTHLLFLPTLQSFMMLPQMNIFKLRVKSSKAIESSLQQKR